MTDKLPKGVEHIGNQLRISFMLHGKRFREPLRGVVKINKAAIAYADNKRRTILAEIKEGRFDYSVHFPNSPSAAQFSGIQGADKNRTVEQGVQRWLEVQKAKRASCTYINYRCKAKHLLKRMGLRRIADISKSDLELLQAHLLKNGLSPKTVNDVFTVVRGVWADAFEDGVIASNPLERISNIERDADLESAFPFTRDELQRLALGDPERWPDVRMIVFNCWAGLSVSELIALAVEDIDLEKGTLHVRRARVAQEYKVPKERTRVRTLELIAPALEILREISAEHDHQESIEIEVVQRDNIIRKKEKITFLFRNSASGKPWSGQTLNAWFEAHLKRCGIPHRGPNQSRHTFASQALSSFVPMEWVARQLGHTDTTMVKKHYGRWIPSDTKSMAHSVSKMMGF
ncbi:MULTISPECIES: tyrosine-type recombinase/integrase [Pseudomonas]|uniref:tyrosine-type recombinase/integrase n=1 Tax=Pseudomonas TaxID=286 RepID=UPI000B80F8C6|nr:tyrosine-type recombinase/integrase [Pseudomonas marincola]